MSGSGSGWVRGGDLGRKGAPSAHSSSFGWYSQRSSGGRFSSGASRQFSRNTETTVAEPSTRAVHSRVTPSPSGALRDPAPGSIGIGSVLVTGRRGPSSPSPFSYSPHEASTSSSSTPSTAHEIPIEEGSSEADTRALSSGSSSEP